ncbi:MAG: methylmalonyl Co-A mutase-associated GTPase MeaB [Nitrososphaeraceae archaeon]
MSDIVAGIISGDKRSISRAISIIDNQEPESSNIIQQIFTMTGKARTIGFTGAAGAGKSTIIGKLAAEFNNLGYKVGVLAIDPTSPFTGGAILGDRVRMMSTISGDIYMRSLASRGADGGISESLRNVTRILDAAGFDIILIESVGAGQLEIEISKAVNITVVVFTPQTGDSVQAIKAGLTEIGDLYVINKSDLDGSSVFFNTIRDLVGDHKKLVLKCSGRTGKGIKELATNLEKQFNNANSKNKEEQLISYELEAMILNIIKEKTRSRIMNSKKFEYLVAKILRKEIDPFAAASEFATSILNKGD